MNVRDVISKALREVYIPRVNVLARLRDCYFAIYLAGYVAGALRAHGVENFDIEIDEGRDGKVLYVVVGSERIPVLVFDPSNCTVKAVLTGERT